MERQQDLPIQVILGNPPWSGGQKSSTDDNPNVRYPQMKNRIAQTYVARSQGMRRGLYNPYKMAIRWASDRIGNEGVIAFVTSGSWVGGNVDSGVRACLAEEFSSIYVLNLRGNQRTQGERSRQEGGKVFGQGSREPVAITILVRNPEALHDGCRILYRDIGDYLRREEKLAVLREAGSIAGIEDWRTITPDRHHDWIGQRSEEFHGLYPMGSKAAKAGKTDEAVFKLFSNGYKTGRDAYIYNFSRHACAENARKMVGDYMGALRLRQGTPYVHCRRSCTAILLKYQMGPRAKGTFRSARENSVFVYEHLVRFVSTVCQAIRVRGSSRFLEQVPDGQHLPCVRYRKPRDLRSRNRIDQAVLGSRGRHDAGS